MRFLLPLALALAACTSDPTDQNPPDGGDAQPLDIGVDAIDAPDVTFQSERPPPMDVGTDAGFDVGFEAAAQEIPGPDVVDAGVADRPGDAAATDASSDVSPDAPLSCGPSMSCPGGLTCCGSRCVNTASDVSSCGACDQRCTIPNAAAVCTAGSCAIRECSANFVNCNGAVGDGCELDTRVPRGRCCADGTRCADRPNAVGGCAPSGACGVTCNAGFADCNGDASDGCEADIRVDPANCGRCAAPCGDAGTCRAGVCS